MLVRASGGLVVSDGAFFGWLRVGCTDYNPTHPAMGSTPVQLLPTVTYAYSATLAPGLVLNWNVVGSRLDFQAVYSGVAWYVEALRMCECV